MYENDERDKMYVFPKMRSFDCRVKIDRHGLWCVSKRLSCMSHIRKVGSIIIYLSICNVVIERRNDSTRVNQHVRQEPYSKLTRTR